MHNTLEDIQQLLLLSREGQASNYSPTKESIGVQVHQVIASHKVTE